VTKILFVFGDDYAAVAFEGLRQEGKVSTEELWRKSWVDAGGKMLVHTDGGWFQYQAYEFGEIDPTFIEFVHDNQDYDFTKAEQFYVV